MPPGIDPKQAMEAMQGVMKNPAFMQMAEKLGTQMMQDPQMASMMQQMQDPATTVSHRDRGENVHQLTLLSSTLIGFTRLHSASNTSKLLQ